MGIKNLRQLVERHAPGVREDHTIEYFKGSKIAIDSSILLYRYLYSKGHLNQPHIVGFLNNVIYFLKNGVVPLFVWDGAPPQEKRGTLSKRSDNKKRLGERMADLEQKIETLQEKLTLTDDDDHQGHNLPTFPDQGELDKFIENQEKLRVYQNEYQTVSKQLIHVKPEHKSDVKFIMNLLQIPNLAAKGEAEALCSDLVKQGKVDYVMSEDTDTLAHGSPNLIQRGAKNNEFVLSRLDRILEGFEFSYEQFVDFCILSGCDYTCTIPEIGPITAYKYVKKWGSIEMIIANLPKKFSVPREFDYKTSRKLFIESFPMPPGWSVNVGGIGCIQWEYNFTTFMSERGFNQYQIQKYIQEINNALLEFKKNY